MARSYYERRLSPGKKGNCFSLRGARQVFVMSRPRSVRLPTDGVAKPVDSAGVKTAANFLLAFMRRAAMVGLQL